MPVHTTPHQQCLNIIGTLQFFTFGCIMLAKSSFLFTHSEWAQFWTSTKYSVANYFQRPCVTLHNFVSRMSFSILFYFSSYVSFLLNLQMPMLFYFSLYFTEYLMCSMDLLVHVCPKRGQFFSKTGSFPV